MRRVREMDLNQRVERLERQNRWLQVVALIALIGSGLMFFMGRPQPAQAKSQVGNTLTGSELILKDKEGKTYLEITRNKLGESAINLRGTDKESLSGGVLIYAGPGQATIEATFPENEPNRIRAQLGADRATAFLEVKTPNGGKKVLTSPAQP
jgi:hypothetical protein